MSLRLIPIVLLAFAGSVAAVDAQPVRAASRGELLYTTHCIACHDDNIHWRDQRRVTGSRSLRSEVNRWQQVLGLGWGKEDIDEVAQYLQALYYRDLRSD